MVLLRRCCSRFEDDGASVAAAAAAPARSDSQIGNAKSERFRRRRVREHRVLASRVVSLLSSREKRSEGKTHLLTGFALARARERPARFFLLISGDDFVY